MNCLLDTVTLIGCGDSVPASGLTLNQLPGISLKALEKVADEEQKDYQGVMSDIQARAAKRFPIDIADKLSKRFKLNLIPMNADLGRDIDATTVTANSAEYRGLLFDFNKYKSESVNSYKASDLQSHYFQSVYFYSNAIHAATPFKVVDYATNATIETITKDLVIGWNLITQVKNYTQSKIAIAVNATAVSTVNLSTPDNLEWCSSCCGATIEGINWSTASDISTSTKGNNSYGLTVVYGSRCSFDNLVCNNTDKFVLAWQYLLGVETVIEYLFSKRISAYTLSKGINEELKAYLQAEYDRILTQVCDSIHLNSDDCCLECSDLIQIRESNSFY